jgi:putative hemolysin
MSLALRAAPIRFTTDWRRFRIAIAATPGERDLALRLRHDVFLDELLRAPRADGVERDEFDDRCDHVLVSDLASGETVGTARLACSLSTDRFYSAGEFAIDGLLALPEIKVEVGRTCLRRSHRNNLALGALGRGIGGYAARAGATWLFGCSSVMTTDLELVALLCARFRAAGDHRRSLGATPRPGHAMPGLEDAIAALDPLAIERADLDALLPPLLRVYRKAGAALSAAPALDREFACVDFLTLLDLRSHDSRFLGRLAPC